MSCSCNNVYYNLPCCCPVNTSTTTTTTTACPDAIPCDEVMDSDCVIYNGPDLECYGISTGASVTDILEVIIAQLPTCVACREIIVTPITEEVTIEYTTCGDTSPTTETISAETTICCSTAVNISITGGEATINITDVSC